MNLEMSKKQCRPIKVVAMKDWFVGRIYKMHRKFGNHWVECGDSIDLMDYPPNMQHPPNMEIGSCWY